MAFVFVVFLALLAVSVQGRSPFAVGPAVVSPAVTAKKSSPPALNIRGGKAIGPINDDNLLLLNAIGLLYFGTEFGINGGKWTSYRYFNKESITDAEGQLSELFSIMLLATGAGVFCLNKHAPEHKNMVGKFLTYLWGAYALWHTKITLEGRLVTDTPVLGGQLSGFVATAAMTVINAVVSFF